MNNTKWKESGHNNRNKSRVLPEWFESGSYALSFIVLIFVFVFRVIVVFGASMQPTLLDQDSVAVQSFFYTPINGDVVVIDGYTNYGKPLVKRIIGIEGDEINIDKNSGELFVNGEKLSEPYIKDKTYPHLGIEYPLTVPEGKIFVLGDNRTNSLDSRSIQIGFINEGDILGKVLIRIMPFNSYSVIK